MEKINKIIQRTFETHKATLIQNSERYCIIDWRRADGSGNCYVNYIVDKKRGSLIVSGDLGDSIATWYNPVEPCNLKKYIHNDVYYYMGKFQCASDKYVYDEDDVISDLKYHIEDEDVRDYVDESCEYDTVEEFWDFIKDEVADCVYRYDFVPSKDLIDVIEDFDDCYWEWLKDCGRRVHTRVYLWAEGFYMACEQLGI